MIRITVARGTMTAQDENDEDSGWNSCAQSVAHGVPRMAKARLRLLRKIDDALGPMICLEFALWV